MNEIDLDKVKNEYKIKPIVLMICRKQIVCFTFMIRMVFLDSIDLNNLSGADFNDIYKEISRQAPHIE